MKPTPDRAGPGGQRPGPLMLLQNKSVQQELRLSDQQLAAIREQAQKLQAQFKGEFEMVRKAGPGAGDGGQLQKKVAAAAWVALGSLLRPEQQQRLRQIQWQARRVFSLVEPDVQQVLNLSAKQKSQLETLLERLQTDAREIMRKTREQGGQPQEGREQLAALRKQALDQATALLTDGQRAAWQGLLGPVFEMQPQPGPRRPGFQGGPGTATDLGFDDL